MKIKSLNNKYKAQLSVQYPDQKKNKDEGKIVRKKIKLNENRYK